MQEFPGGWVPTDSGSFEHGVAVEASDQKPWAPAAAETNTVCPFLVLGFLRSQAHPGESCLWKYCAFHDRDFATAGYDGAGLRI